MIEKLPKDYLNNMRALLGEEYEAFLQSYSQPALRGLRINTKRTSVERFLTLSKWKLSPTNTIDNGFIIEERVRKIGYHPYHIGGAFYMQEPSAMSVIAEVERLNILNRPLKVLDLCAAPGGKSTGVGEKLSSDSVIVANELVRSRANELISNIERLGITNSVVTNLYPKAVAEYFPSYFDLVLVDAPCSGEGMFRKNPEVIYEWSTERVRSSAEIQREILSHAKSCVKPGGYLIYSTCTFNTIENEGTIDCFLNINSDFELISQRRIFPHTHRGEGHFVCAMRKSEEAEYHPPRKPKAINQYRKVKDSAFYELMSEIFTDFDSEAYILGDNYYMASPGLIETASIVPNIYSGVLAGIQKKNRIEPTHTLFMAAHGYKYRNQLDFSPDSEELRSYLSGNTLAASDEGRYYLISCDGFPLGYAKQSDGLLKNKLPKGLRVYLREEKDEKNEKSETEE